MSDTKERAKARKRAQREREKESGINKVEIQLDDTELNLLSKNCALRRPGKEPYSRDEYIQMLIRRDEIELQKTLAKLNKRCCGKCGEQLPVTECCLSGDRECWNTVGWHELKLTI